MRNVIFNITGTLNKPKTQFKTCYFYLSRKNRVFLIESVECTAPLSGIIISYFILSEQLGRLRRVIVIFFMSRYLSRTPDNDNLQLSLDLEDVISLTNVVK